MNLRLDQIEWVWLLWAIVPSLIAALLWLRAMSTARRWSVVVLRAAFLLLLTAALAGLATTTRTDRLATIAVIDVSGSVERFAPRINQQNTSAVIDAALAAASQSPTRRPDDLLGVVAFDGQAQSLMTPSRARWNARTLDPSGKDGTDIAQALRLAAAMLPPDATGRILLISDGNQTSGDALRAISNSASIDGIARTTPIPVDVVPIVYDLRGEVMIRSLDAPPRAIEDSVITLRVTILASTQVTGTLRLFDNDQPLTIVGQPRATERRLTLQPGEHIESIDIKLPPGRTHRLRAMFEPDSQTSSQPNVQEDQFTENNSAEAFTFAPGQGSVLLVDGVSDAQPSGAGSTLALALQKSGISVNTIAPGGLPSTLLGFEPFDLVILENVPADALPDGSADALASFVREMGGGLVMIGGPASFGAGGWKSSPLEEILPVKLDLPERLVTPEVAIVFVMDCSGSMRRSVMGSSRSQQQIANESAALALGTLDKRDLVGVIKFNEQADDIVPLAPLTDVEAVADRIRSIKPDGGTDALPGLELAFKQLSDVEAKTKHVIVLSDGRSKNAPSLPDLCAKLAENGIKITTISVGDEADIPTMEAMAKRGGGEAYNVTNPNILPRVFAKAVRVIRTPNIREEPFQPLILNPASVMIAGLPAFPTLNGLTLTQPRSEPTIVNALVTPDGEPVLSHWSVELGQVVAFTSDAHRWASNWLDWPGYQQLWTQIARQASRAGTQALAATAEVRSGRLIVRADDPTPTSSDSSSTPTPNPAPGRLLAVPVSVFSPDGSRREMLLQQIAPSQYEGSIPAPRDGTYVAVLKPADDGRRLPPSVVGATANPGKEFRTFRSDEALLAQLAKSTGGRLIPLDQLASADLFDRAGVPPRYAVSPIWKGLLSAALIVLLLDIATRRIAWDRLGSGRLPSIRRSASMDLGRLRRPGSAQPASLTLDDADAANLREAARDRRRAERLRQSENQTSTDTDANSSGGLLAAKRRAASRFEPETPKNEESQ